MIASSTDIFDLKSQLPFTSNFLEINGQKLHYIDEGKGPVVFLLHGNPTWCFFYRNLIAQLKGSFRVIALDYIGCGLSDHPADKHYRAVDRVAEVEALYQHLKIGKFSIVMHDWGGAIGTRFLQNHLELVEGVVYLNTTLTEVESLPLIIKASAQKFIGKFLTKYSSQFLRFATGPGVVKKLPKGVVDGYMYPYQTVARRTAIWDFVSDIPFTSDHPTYKDMSELADGFSKMQSIPIKIIWGLKDPCFHGKMLRKIAAHFPKAEVLELPEASHLVLEDEQERTGSVIKDFFFRCHQQCYAELNEGAPVQQGSQNVLYKRFRESAQDILDTPAVIIPSFLGSIVRYGTTTFRELGKIINQYQRGFESLGLTAGDRVVFLVPPSEEFIALSYAVMARGGVPVFLDPGMGVTNVINCIHDCRPAGFVGSPKAFLLKLKDKNLFEQMKFTVVASNIPFPKRKNLSFLKSFSAGELPPSGTVEDQVMIAYTSGATGTPKGVIFTNGMLEEQLRIFRDVFEMKPGTKDLPLLPVFSIFSMGLGVCSIFPPMNSAKPLAVNPARIIRIIMDLAVETSFGSPTLWNKLSNYCIRYSDRLTSMRRIFIAGAPVSNTLLTRLNEILDNGEVFTPYGATEALPVTFVSAEELLSLNRIPAITGDIGTPVGRAVSGVKIKVISLDSPTVISSIKDVKECAPLTIGEIIVQGKNVSRNYLNQRDAEARSKIADDAQGDFWHRMGDVGYIAADGMLYYCGRKVHTVFAEDRTYVPDGVENIFNEAPHVARSALVSLHDGAKAGVAIEPIAGCFPETAQEKEHFVRILLDIGSKSLVTNNLKDFYFFKSFPVDARHNAKIFRDKLSKEINQLTHES